jgi:hypothetical protein
VFCLRGSRGFPAKARVARLWSGEGADELDPPHRSTTRGEGSASKAVRLGAPSSRSLGLSSVRRSKPFGGTPHQGAPALRRREGLALGGLGPAPIDRDKMTSEATRPPRKRASAKGQIVREEGLEKATYRATLYVIDRWVGGHNAPQPMR